jgi:phage-related tail fiber protein
MAYDKEKPTDDEYIAAGPAAIRENFRALKEDKIVDAGKVNGLTVGNESGDIPKANGIVCTNLNAEYLGGNPAGYFSPATHTHSAATTSSNGLMANTDKTKLDSIAAGAQVNQNAFASVLVGGTTIQADSATDTLELVAGNNVSLTPSATNDRITIAVSGAVPAATTATACTGNAATATTLQTARTIGISGDANGAATSFNGSTNITIPVTLAASGVTAGTYSSVTVDAKGRVTGGTNPTTISANTTGNAATATTANNANVCAGNAATATKLATSRTINLTGAVTGSGSFDGSTNLSITTSSGTIPSHGKQLFITSGTFVVPIGINTVWVTMCGGGGGAGGGRYSSLYETFFSGGNGGGAGCSIAQAITVTAGEIVKITIGAGGVGGYNSYNSGLITAGASGGITTFGSYISCSGGGGGAKNTSNSNYLSTSDTIGLSGGFGGQPGFNKGGNSIFGIGGSPTNSTLSYLATGIGFGSGGACVAILDTVTACYSGAGAPGFVLVEW